MDEKLPTKWQYKRRKHNENISKQILTHTLTPTHEQTTCTTISLEKSYSRKFNCEIPQNRRELQDYNSGARKAEQEYLIQWACW